MRFFTPSRFLALQERDPGAMDAADADWETAVEQYDAYLQTILPDLPESVRQLLDGFYLHDARILSIGHRSDRFVISLQLDVPPNDLLTIVYSLAGPTEVSKEGFCLPGRAISPLWECDEIELTNEGSRQSFIHDIMLSNGWVLRIPFRGSADSASRADFPPRFVSPRRNRSVSGRRSVLPKRKG